MNENESTADFELDEVRSDGTHLPLPPDSNFPVGEYMLFHTCDIYCYPNGAPPWVEDE